MARTRFNPRRVKIHFSYTVEQIAQALAVHKNTVRGWLGAGLETIDSRRPAMVQGKVLRAYLERKRKSGRRTCPPGTLYCVKCRAPRPPALGMVEFVPFSPTNGNIRGLCDECGTLIHRRANIARLPAVMPDLEVSIREGEARLKGSGSPSLICDSDGEQVHA